MSTRSPLEVLDEANLRPWIRSPVLDLRGRRAGSLERILRDPENDLRWLWVNLAPRGRLRFGLVPAAGAVYGKGRVFAAHTRELIRTVAQSADAVGYVDGALRSASYRHYGLVGLPRRRAPVRLPGAERDT